MTDPNVGKGKDNIVIAGHKVPLAVVGVAVGLAGLLLVLRARKGGGNVVSTGTAPASANPSAYDPNSSGYFSGSQDAQLANIEQQLSKIDQGLNAQPSGASSNTLPPPGTLPDTAGTSADWRLPTPGALGYTYAQPTVNVGGKHYFALQTGHVADIYRAQGGQSYFFPQPGIAVSSGSGLSGGGITTEYGVY